MIGWHHRLNGSEFEQTVGYGDGQGSLMCCSPRGRKESDTTGQLNKNRVRRRLTMGPLAYAVRTITEEKENGSL